MRKRTGRGRKEATKTCAGKRKRMQQRYVGEKGSGGVEEGWGGRRKPAVGRRRR
jgi:hypothetical protein